MTASQVGQAQPSPPSEQPTAGPAPEGDQPEASPEPEQQTAPKPTNPGATEQQPATGDRGEGESVEGATGEAPAAPAPTTPRRAPTKQERRLAAEHSEQAKAFRRVEVYDQALLEYQAAYRLDPNMSTAFNLGQVHEKLGQETEAIVFYNLFLELSHARIGTLTGTKKQQLDSARTEATAKIVKLERTLASHKEAQKLAEEAAQREAQAKQYRAEAARHLAAEELDLALDQYQKLHALTKDPEVLFDIAETQRLMGNKSDAIVTYEQYGHELPEPIHAAEALTYKTNLEQELQNEAREAAEAAKKSDPPGTGFAHAIVGQAVHGFGIELAATLPNPAGSVLSAYYKTAKAPTYQATSMVLANGQYVATIPAEAVTDPTIHYYIQVTHQGQIVATSGSADHPNTIAVSGIAKSATSDAFPAHDVLLRRVVLPKRAFSFDLSFSFPTGIAKDLGQHLLEVRPLEDMDLDTFQLLKSSIGMGMGVADLVFGVQFLASGTDLSLSGDHLAYLSSQVQFGGRQGAFRIEMGMHGPTNSVFNVYGIHPSFIAKTKVSDRAGIYIQGGIDFYNYVYPEDDGQEEIILDLLASGTIGVDVRAARRVYVRPRLSLCRPLTQGIQPDPDPGDQRLDFGRGRFAFDLDAVYAGLVDVYASTSIVFQGDERQIGVSLGLRATLGGN